MSKKINNFRWEEIIEKQNSINPEINNNENSELIESYFFIFDWSANEISFVNDSFTKLTGYPKNEFTINKLLQIIHPHDLDYYYNCVERDLEIVNQLKFNQHYQYLFTCSFRIIDSKGISIYIQQQSQTIEVNNFGNLGKTMITHKKIPGYFKKPMDDHKVFDKNKGIYIDSENTYKLTKREYEIINLIKEGYSSSEISKKLHISKHTIDTHRKNILNKTNSSNFIELINKLSFSKF